MDVAPLAALRASRKEAGALPRAPRSIEIVEVGTHARGGERCAFLHYMQRIIDRTCGRTPKGVAAVALADKGKGLLHSENSAYDIMFRSQWT
jgi:hypothetical protein